MTNTSPISSATSTTAEPAPVYHRHGPLDVVIQVGDYHIATVPDLFTTGPELIVFGDGAVYSNKLDHDTDGVASFSHRHGQMSEGVVQQLLRDALALPPDATIGQGPSDGFPILLKSGTRHWEIYDTNTEPFATYLDEVRTAVRSVAISDWQPTRWIESRLDSSDPQNLSVQCAVVQSTNAGPLYSAPVYPNALGQYPIEPFPCFG